jgi:Fe2+ or Zn2+ uptake regulation protein
MMREEKREENELANVMRALDSSVRRMIMLLALEGPKTSLDYKEKLVESGFDVKYKESVYKDLQLLVDAGLVEKYYDKEKKAIVYGSRIDSVVFDLMKWSIYLKEDVPKRLSP